MFPAATCKFGFSLAYNYSKAGQDKLALYHYLNIPYQERGEGSWNNVGVQYDCFDLNSKSVQAYRKARDQQSCWKAQ